MIRLIFCAALSSACAFLGSCELPLGAGTSGEFAKAAHGISLNADGIIKVSFMSNRGGEPPLANWHGNWIDIGDNNIEVEIIDGVLMEADIPQVSRQGWGFLGWYPNPDGTGARLAAGVGADEMPCVFYAKWERLPLASGGEIKYLDGGGGVIGHEVHTFKNNGMFLLTNVNFATVSYLVVGGGASGGDLCSGGIGGVVEYGTVDLTSGIDCIVAVGRGGAALPPGVGLNGSPGGLSAFGRITAEGGVNPMFGIANPAVNTRDKTDNVLSSISGELYSYGVGGVRVYNANGADGGANTGDGGESAFGRNFRHGAGGSGIVIVKFAWEQHWQDSEEEED